MSQTRHAPTAPTYTRRLAAGAMFDRHRHEEHQLVYLSAGATTITTERGTWTVPSDRAVFIPAGYWHEHHFYGTATFHTIGFTADVPALQPRVPTVIGVDELLRELIVVVADGGLPDDETARLRAVIIDRLRRAEPRPLFVPRPRDARLIAACQIVERDLEVSIGLEELGRAVGAGGRTLSRLFRTELAMSYPAWRTRARLAVASVLLAEGVPVSRVALRCGWSTASAFIDTYRSHFGSTPGRAVAR